VLYNLFGVIGRAHLGHPAKDILFFRIELCSLRHWIENAEKGRGIRSDNPPVHFSESVEDRHLETAAIDATTTGWLLPVPR
jgi:hypothetical protein